MPLTKRNNKSKERSPTCRQQSTLFKPQTSLIEAHTSSVRTPVSRLINNIAHRLRSPRHLTIIDGSTRRGCRLHDTAQWPTKASVGTASRPARAWVDDLDIIATSHRAHDAIRIKCVQTSPACWWMDELGLVLALGVTGGRLVELVCCASNGVRHGLWGPGVTSVGFGVGKRRRVLAAGKGVLPVIGLGGHWWGWNVVWVVGVVDGDLGWGEGCCCCLGSSDFDWFWLLDDDFGCVC